MTVMAGPRSATPDVAVGQRPDWVSAVFVDMYPDDTIVVPTAHAATVLACDEDWAWIAVHAAVVAGAVDGACSALAGAGAGEWVICRCIVDGHVLVVCTVANAAGSAACEVGNVVLVLRPSADAFLAQDRAVVPG